MIIRRALGAHVGLKKNVATRELSMHAPRERHEVSLDRQKRHVCFANETIILMIGEI